MRQFIDERRTVEDDNVGIESTDTYIEVEFPIDDENALVLTLF